MSNEVNKEEPSGFVFDKLGYILVLTGIMLIISGFILMSGGGSEDPNYFNADEIFSFRRITLAPIVVMTGFALEVYAIMRKPTK
jgi:hypothetical protein